MARRKSLPVAVRGQGGLHLGRVHVDPAADDEVETPAREVEVPRFIEAAQITDGAGRSPPGRSRRLVVAPVAEVGERRHVAPHRSRAVVGIGLPLDRAHGEVPAGPGATHRARMFEPLVGPTHGELAFRRSVELPHLPRMHARHGRPLERWRAGRTGVSQEAKGIERLVDPEVR